MPKNKKKKELKPVNALARAELARLRNIQANQYGDPGNQKLLIRLANLVGKGRKSSGSQDWKVRAGRATVDPEALRAGRTVQAELNPQIGAAKNYEAGLQKMYDQIGQYMQQTSGDIAASTAASNARTATGYDQLASTIAGEFRKGKEASNAELQRLGIGMGDSSQASEMESRLASLAASGKANALSSGEMQAQGFNQLMGLLSAQSANTGAALRAASSQQRGALEASRPGKVYSLWQQLEDQARAEEMERKQQQFLNRITRARFGVESDYKQAAALSQLADARKKIVESRKPRKVRVKRINP